MPLVFRFQYSLREMHYGGRSRSDLFLQASIGEGKIEPSSRNRNFPFLTVPWLPVMLHCIPAEWMKRNDSKGTKSSLNIIRNNNYSINSEWLCGSFWDERKKWFSGIKREFSWLPHDLWRHWRESLHDVLGLLQSYPLDMRSASFIPFYEYFLYVPKHSVFRVSKN
jgi:hypothetical protein